MDATQLGTGSQEIRASGARSEDNNFMLNGIDANSYGSNITEVTPFGGAGIAIPAPDTIQEFKAQNSLYGAQYGRGGGANAPIGATTIASSSLAAGVLALPHAGCLGEKAGKSPASASCGSG